MYQSLIKRRRDQEFKIYKLKGNLSWLRVLQTVCNLYFYYYYFIIRDEFEFNDLEYCVLISVLRLTNGLRARLNLNIQNHCFIKIKILRFIFD